MCTAGMCAVGYALAADGSCKRCSELTYSNCDSCTDVTGNGTSAVSKCLTCKDGYTKQDDDSACLCKLRQFNF